MSISIARLGLVCITRGEEIRYHTITLHDSRHNEIIEIMPSSAFKAPWVEVEAKGKENAIERLRALYPALR
jgi:hypothetical protein